MLRRKIDDRPRQRRFGRPRTIAPWRSVCEAAGGEATGGGSACRTCLIFWFTVIVAAVEAGVPGLADARDLVERFQTMIRTKTTVELDGWIEQARTSLIAPLARGVSKDVAAIRAAITEPWSNGQTKGQITRLKLVKRQMYGRAKLDLLGARLIGAA